MLLNMSLSWTLSLNTDELNLVLRALRGALRGDQINDAQELAHRIAELRVNETKHRLAETAKLEANLVKNE